MSHFTSGRPGGLEPWEQEYTEGVDQSLAELSPRRRLIILFSVGLVTAIENSNRIAINVLLPDLQGNVAGSSDDVSWVIILYNLGFLCSMAISYWTNRILGPRRHLLYSVALYAVGVVGCFSSAHSLKSLLISRVVMGFGGGAFLVRSVVLVRLMFPAKARLFVTSWLYLELYFFASVYPAAMGWISDTLRWNYAFLLDFPFLAVGAYLIWKVVPREHRPLRSEKSFLDLWGAGLLITASDPYRLHSAGASATNGFSRRSSCVFCWWPWFVSQVFSGGTGDLKIPHPFCICAPSGGTLRYEPPLRSSL